ncbi:neutral/alkaline non-lysosomal ceramidase N-terminal domain-containing protein [Cyclobacterium sediminis]
MLNLTINALCELIFSGFILSSTYNALRCYKKNIGSMGKLLKYRFYNKFMGSNFFAIATIKKNKANKKYFWLVFVLLLISNVFNVRANLIKKDIRDRSTILLGATSLNITPPVGSVMGNSYGINISEGIHDDLFAKVLVFDVSGVKGAFLALDLISLPYGMVLQVRELIAQETDIPVGNVILTATHCHAGPQMNPRFLKAVGGEAEIKSLEYIKQLPKKLLNAIKIAEDSLQPVQVSFGTFYEDKVNFNRRFLMKDGSFRTNPGRLNPGIDRAMGPVDPIGSVLLFESMDKKPLAVLVNFALHPAIVGGNQFSADFPGIVSQQLEKVYGKELVTVYTNGNSGNINHIDVKNESQLGQYEESARIGRVLAEDVLKAIGSLKPLEINSLKVGKMEVTLPIPNFTHEELVWAEEIIGQFGKTNPPKFSDVVEAWRILDLKEGNYNDSIRSQFTTTVPLTKDRKAIVSEVQVMGFGSELALVGFPGDAFVELSMAIKLKSPFTHTIICEQSGNGNLSYIPDRKAFSEGGYEVQSARFMPGGGELLVEGVQKLMIELFYD